ncbi:hypothetical protein Tco_0122035 [Tanacetum coccineum]
MLADVAPKIIGLVGGAVEMGDNRGGGYRYVVEVEVGGRGGGRWRNSAEEVNRILARSNSQSRASISEIEDRERDDDEMKSREPARRARRARGEREDNSREKTHR